MTTEIKLVLYLAECDGIVLGARMLRQMYVYVDWHIDMRT